MKIMMVTIDFPPTIFGGEGVFAGKIADLLSDKGVELEVIAPVDKKAVLHDLNKNYIIHRVPMIGRTFVTKMPSFAYNAGKIVKQFDGDLLYMLRPCFPFHRKYIAHFHTTRYSEALGCFRTANYLAAGINYLYIPFDKYFAGNADKIIALSSNMKKHIEWFTRNSDDKIKIIGNGVDLKVFNCNSKRTFNNNRMLFVGRLDYQKAIFDLLDGFKLLKQRNSELQLSIIGSGPLECKIMDFIKDNNFNEDIKLIGKVKQTLLSQFYNSSDLVVLPSINEGFGLVILEAMACGTPVITSDACADLGQPRFRAGNISEFVLMANDILGSNRRLVALSERGKSIANRNIWENVAYRLIHMFKETIT